MKSSRADRLAGHGNMKWGIGKGTGAVKKEKYERVRGQAAPFRVSGTGGCCQAFVGYSVPDCSHVAVLLELRQNTNILQFWFN